MQKYKAYSINNFHQIPQIDKLSQDYRFNIEVVGSVLPFKVNNYVINELINWDNFYEDPIFILTFPQKEMLLKEDFNKISNLIKNNADRAQIKEASNKIRYSLNPHPAGQMKNVPSIDGEKLIGIQHKYRETVLFFASQSQTCHAYCTFCFRWPQFVGIDELKFGMRETEYLVEYIKRNRKITDVLFTGGDPLIMSAEILESYINPLLADDLENIQTIRIGTKAFSYWPYKFLTDKDADVLMRLFEKIIKKGKNLAIMAHFNHPVELSTNAVKEAIFRVRSTGAQIRTQSPVLKHINDRPEVWAEMWRKQVNYNCIPYYMFIARDTGAKHYFEIPLIKAWNVFRDAYQRVSGVCRTVRGPSMSCTPGKVQILGVGEIADKKVITLRMIQGRNPDWVAKPFFAEYDENATWINELKPAFGAEKFFFEDELEEIYKESIFEKEEESFE